MIIFMKEAMDLHSLETANVIKVAGEFPGIAPIPHKMQGLSRSVLEIHLIGPTSTIPEGIFEQQPGVEKVIRIRERYRAIGRHEGHASSIGFEFRGLRFDQDSFHIFAGLCAVDNKQNTESMFRELQRIGIQTTRAGAYKPRTSPYDFQGHGRDCLPYVFELAGKYGIQVIAMEVTRESHVDEIREALRLTGDATGVMLQIGTRNAQNFELLKFVGQQTEMPVLYKRGMGITLEESLNACEYIATSGNHKIIFALRGVKTHLGEPHRNMVDFAHVPILRRLTRLPVCVDPSHAVGGRVRGPDGLTDIHQVTAQGVIAGANMVLVDFHPSPQAALCDGPQALRIEELEEFVEDVRFVRQTYLERSRRAQKKDKQ